MFSFRFNQTSMDEFRFKFWTGGKFVAFFCFFESALKLAFSVSELIFGHFRNVSSNESRSLCEKF